MVDVAAQNGWASALLSQTYGGDVPRKAGGDGDYVQEIAVDVDAIVTLCVRVCVRVCMYVCVRVCVCMCV